MNPRDTDHRDTAVAGHGHGGGVFAITTNTRVFDDTDVAPIRAEIRRISRAIADELENRKP